MKNKILLYLFIFAVLFSIFIYMNDKRILDAKEERIGILENKLSETEASLAAAQNAERDEYFTFDNNEDALTYFENKGVATQDLSLKIEDAIISKNKAGEDNPLVPHAGMEGDMRINKIKVLNHKWIIADFTDGSYWGEIFLTYEVSENGEISFATEKSFLYPQS